MGAIFGYNSIMPIISMFFGIVIRMSYKEHEPVHFHAEYQGQQGRFDLDGEMVAGNLIPRPPFDSFANGLYLIGTISMPIGKT